MMDGLLIPGRELILPSRAAGSGGGGKGGGGSSEARNTNRSQARVRVIDLLCEGPILGLEDGGKSIYLNNTPLVSSDGKDNFRGVSWEFRNGLVDQEPIRGFPIAENTEAVNNEIVHGTGPVVRSYASDNATAARIVLRFPALFYQDTQNNRISQTSLHFTIEIRPLGGTYETAHDVNWVDKKWMSPYEREFLVSFPESPTNNWEIKITKITLDPSPSQYEPSRPDNSSVLQNTIIWGSTGLLTERNLIYPDSALIAISFDSASFGGGLPQRWYKLMGRLVRVPVNYDPVARTYARVGAGMSGGMWDGVSFRNAWTNNPAWVCYDILTNSRFACGLDDALLGMTRFELYMIGQYSDERVPDGFGGFEPRYSMNAWINTADDAYRFLQRIVQTFRGMSYWASGQVSMVCDMPTEAAALVTNANVVNGEFVYEGVSLKVMHTMARIRFRNPDNNYEQDIEVVDDAVRMAMFGERVIDMEAFGCTSRGEAHRLGKWALDTERTSTEMVSYECGLDQVSLRPGEIVEIQDQWYSGVRAGGRIREAGANWVMLDARFVQDSTDYRLSTVRPDGEMQLDLVIASFNDTDPAYTKVTLAHDFPMIPLLGSIWVIATQAVPARQFRVLVIQEHEKGMAKVSGLLHDPTKYARVEYGIALESGIFTTQTALAAPIPPPTAIVAVKTSYGEGVTTIVRVTVSVSPALDGRIVGTLFAAERVDDETVTYADSGTATADIDHLRAGSYNFYGRSLAADGRVSDWIRSETPLTVDPYRSDLPQILDVIAAGGLRTVLVKWTAPTDRGDIRHYEVWRAPVELAAPEALGGTLFDRTDAFQTIDSAHGLLVPGSTWYYWVRAVGLHGDVGPFSDAAVAVVELVARNDLGRNVILHDHIAYATITRVAHDELTMPFDATNSLNEVILSVTVDVDSGGKVAVIGRTYAPNANMGGAGEPYGGGGGTDNPDPGAGAGGGDGGGGDGGDGGGGDGGGGGEGGGP